MGDPGCRHRGDRRRAGRLSPAEETPFRRVPAHDCPPAPAHQQVRRHVPHPFQAGPGRTRLLPGARLQLDPHPHHHRRRLRRRRRVVPGHDPGSAGSAEAQRRGRFRPGLFRQGSEPYGFGTTGGGGLLSQPGTRVYLRPDVPRGRTPIPPGTSPNSG